MKGTGATAATRGAGRSEGFVGATPTGVELGLKVGGIGQLGISTDYGGGIVIGIFGQKIVWGREGGKIHYNFGGLEVIVEARDCVVVETRKIFGQVTGRHVYPDPGCKLPPEPDPQSQPDLIQPLPKPGEYGPLIPVGMDSTDMCVVLLDETYFLSHTVSSRSSGELIFTYLAEGKASLQADKPPKIENANDFIDILRNRISGSASSKAKQVVYRDAPFTFVDYYLPCNPTVDGESTYSCQLTPNYNFRGNEFPSTGIGSALRVPLGRSNIQSSRYFLPDCVFPDGSRRTYNGGLVYSGYPHDSMSGIVFYGQENVIKQIIIDRNRYLSNQTKNHSNYPNYILYQQYVVKEIIKVPSPLPRFPSAGNQPPMPESCCEALAADIEDIKEVLATKEILAGKMTFPWKWRMPGGQGDEVIMDYPNLMRAIAQMIDHLGIHPPKLSIKDINNAVAGDQSISNQFPSATQGFEALMAQIWDANADVDTLTNFLYRLSWLCVQQSMNIARMSGDVQCIKDMFGGETTPTDTSITTPFNIVAGIVEKPTKGQEFGKEKGKIDNRIDANTEIATESLLPDFLKIRENPIVVERFTGEKDLFDLIALIILKLESLQRT